MISGDVEDLCNLLEIFVPCVSCHMSGKFIDNSLLFLSQCLKIDCLALMSIMCTGSCFVGEL